MNITREQLIEFLKSEGVSAAYVFDEDYTIAVDAFFERTSQESAEAMTQTLKQKIEYTLGKFEWTNSSKEEIAAEIIQLINARNEGWQPIVTAPKDGTMILCLVKGVHPETGAPFLPQLSFYDNVYGWRSKYEAGTYKPDFWISIPEPPKNL